MAITNDKLPWLIDINVFMTPIAQTNWDTNTVSTSAIRNGYKASTGAVNAEINFDVTLAAGSWTIELLHLKGTNQGVFTVLIDSTSVGTVDAYNASTTYNNKSSVSVTVDSAGKKRLTLRMATKNASSTSYVGSLQHVQLRRTA